MLSMSSCWIFLQTFQTYFCIQANSVDPDQTAPICFYGELEKIILELSLNTPPKQFLWL